MVLIFRQFGAVVAILFAVLNGSTRASAQETGDAVAGVGTPPALQDGGTTEPHPPAPGVVFCVAPDYQAQRVYFAAPKPVAEASAAMARRASLRFARAVVAQQQADVGARRDVCSAAPTYLAAAAALRRALTPLLSQGYIAVPVGVF